MVEVSGSNIIGLKNWVGLVPSIHGSDAHVMLLNVYRQVSMNDLKGTYYAPFYKM